jgi:hypothetical protein
MKHRVLFMHVIDFESSFDFPRKTEIYSIDFTPDAEALSRRVHEKQFFRSQSEQEITVLVQRPNHS